MELAEFAASINEHGAVMKTIMTLFLICAAVVCGFLVVSMMPQNREKLNTKAYQLDRTVAPELSDRSQRFRNNTGPKVGEIAPPFKLKSFDNQSETELASFRGKIPVVLIFGSYT